MAIVRMLSVLVGAGLKLLFIQLAMPIVAFALLLLVESTIMHVGMLFMYRWVKRVKLRWSFDKQFAKRILTEAWPLALSTAMVQIYMKIDQVMLATMSDMASAGYYAVAARLSEVWYVFPVIVTATLFPLLVKAKQIDEVTYNKRVQQMYDCLAWAAIVVALPVTLCSNWLVNTLFGLEYSSSALILNIHIWSAIFVFLETGRIRWLISEKLTKFQLISTSLGAASNITLNLVLIPKFGGAGAAVATLISYAISVYISCFIFSPLRPAALQMTLAFVAPFRIRRNLGYLKRVQSHFAGINLQGAK
jgi:O-antigen/teichoic acid export membrane protein